jgi:hypothetical protein
VHLQGLVASDEQEAAVVAVEEAAIRMDPETAEDEGIGVMEAMILIYTCGCGPSRRP